MASQLYSLGCLEIVNNGLALKTLKVALLRSSPAYTFSHAHQYFSSVSPSECNATNYTAGGKTVALTIRDDGAAGKVEIEIPDQTWTALGGATNNTIQWAILYASTGNNATSPLIAAWDLTGSTYTTNGTDFMLDFDASAGNITFDY